ncbi:PqiB family protein [Desulfogranum marinum]|uniref:PqiB family protein n=1 Tax=Desulfogranum marinum TaxID=453220 RepID=UPI001965CA4E|nr:MlaD family protein [Desulfogranum marinum]MBM9513961.1 MCE family protein [Desulfogranum marinum]
MKKNTEPKQSVLQTADPVIKSQRSISIVWLIPIVALLIGGWLAYKAITEKGPTITLSFSTAEGLKAGETKVKYKSVDVGVVESIHINENLSKVVLDVQMNKGSESYLTDQTKFWVVRARVSAGQVSGLSTLLGGAYIGIEPSAKGKEQRDFIGLETAPIVTNTTKGTFFQLAAPRLGSLNPGSPVYFRQVKVGQVVEYQMDTAGKTVDVNIFIDSPYDRFVRKNTRFWLASGLDVQLTANGIQVDTESVVSLIIGGVAFGTFGDQPLAELPSEHTKFRLYESRNEAKDDQYQMRHQYYVEFFESIRGLSIGAPVEFRGIQIGKVTDVALKLSQDKLNFSTMVLLDVERDRLGLTDEKQRNLDQQVKEMMRNGLRAQLKTGSLLTGQLLVDIDYYPDKTEIKEKRYNNLLVVPSVPSSTQEVLNGVVNFINRVDKLPIEEISKSLQNSLTNIEKIIGSPAVLESIHSLRSVLAELDETANDFNADTIPEITATLQQLHELTTEVRGWLSADSPVQSNLIKSLEEIAKASRSINNLADMLERHPEALLQGKKAKRK